MTGGLRSSAAFALLAVIGVLSAGCGSNDTGSTGSGNSTATTKSKAVKFAQCMRDNGVQAFPDPDASGELTIDGVLNGSSLNPDSAAWKNAYGACNELQPAGFTGHRATPKEQQDRLRFAQCIRDHGVKDFPDPTEDSPLVDTNRIPSANTSGGMSILNAAMAACGRIAERLGSRNK